MDYIVKQMVKNFYEAIMKYSIKEDDVISTELEKNRLVITLKDGKIINV
jgi:hypothetical protein